MKNENSLMQNTIKDFEEIYSLALDKGNFSAALKAKELLGRTQGLFSLKNQTKEKISLTDLSEAELTALIDEAERQLFVNSQSSQS